MKIVPDNLMYARVANFVGSRQDLTAERLSELEDVVQDSAKAQAILEASKVSMGEVLSVGLRTSMDELFSVGMWWCCWFSVSSLWCATFALGKRPVVCLCACLHPNNEPRRGVGLDCLSRSRALLKLLSCVVC